MNAIFQHATELRGLAGVEAAWMVHLVRRCLRALLRWQDEHAASAQLSAMSDRELRDIGLARSEIASAVKGGMPRGRLVRP